MIRGYGGVGERYLCSVFDVGSRVLEIGEEMGGVEVLNVWVEGKKEMEMMSSKGNEEMVLIL